MSDGSNPRIPATAPADIAIGTTCEVPYRVAAADSPRTLRLDDGDEFPDVLSTAKMVGLMELAAARALRPLLVDGEVSVGVHVDIAHLAATPLFANVRARATYLGREGRLHAFDVELHDDGGLAGKGRHTRAVVAPTRLVEKARQRIAAGAA